MSIRPLACGRNRGLTLQINRTALCIQANNNTREVIFVDAVVLPVVNDGTSAGIDGTDSEVSVGARGDGTGAEFIDTDCPLWSLPGINIGGTFTADGNVLTDEIDSRTVVR